MDENIKESLQNESAIFIARLFQNHNFDCVVKENNILFIKEVIEIKINCFDKSSNTDIRIVQVDVCLNYNLKFIVESFAGIGENLKLAINDAIDNFTKNSFHVLLATFFTSKFDSEILKDNWSINGKDFEIISGHIGVRGEYDLNLSNKWHDQLKEKVKNIDLQDGLHWLRLFYSQTGNTPTVCEVLLDNEIQNEIGKEAKNFEWHKQDEFYSLRLFIILKHGRDFGRLAKLTGSNLDYDDMFLSLSKLGYSELEVEKAYSIIPEVFGRKLIKEMGVKGNFSEVVTVVNDDKEEFEMDLNKEEIYLKAILFVDNITQNGWTDQFKMIALSSAPLNALNQALNGGVKLEDITCEAFRTMFMIPSYLKVKSLREKKPFWKFW